VGREPEVGLLREAWVQATEGLGQVVVLRGEAGIGKSRLMQQVTAQLADAGHTRLECHCSPYFQHTAFYPLVTALQQAWHFRPEDPAEAQLYQVAGVLERVGLPVEPQMAGWAALLGLPLPAHYPPGPQSPQLQRQQTLEAVLAWLLKEAEQQPVCVTVEDCHWADASTLEWLTLLLDQVPTARLLVLLVGRPEWALPWAARAHLTPLSLRRLRRPHVEAMVQQLTSHKRLPPEVLAYLVATTDGVPLFVEELTKLVLESGLLKEWQGQYTLVGPLAALTIPATLHDALMARLDRLGPAKQVAQLGATIGREFSYAILQAVAAEAAAELPQQLAQLVEAELLYQRGSGPDATYRFKHAMIQDAAYQSLLRSTRQQYHQRIAQVLEAHFTALVEVQPELLAHHYTEAGLVEPAIPAWQRAGQQALERSANVEAVRHLKTALTLLVMLPATPVRDQQELELQLALGPALMASKSPAAPEVEQTYARARTLCQQIGETAQLFPTLRGLCEFYRNRGELPVARELGEQLNRLAQGAAAPLPRLEAHIALGTALYFLGEYAAARIHLELGLELSDQVALQTQALRYDVAPQVTCRIYLANTLWGLGLPAQALRRIQEALALAQTLAHAHSLALAQNFAAFLHYLRRDAPMVQAQADALLTVATAQGFALWVGVGTLWRGWARAVQSQDEAAVLIPMRQSVAAVMDVGQTLSRSLGFVLLAEAAGCTGQSAEGLHLLAEALTAFETSGRGDLLAEAYRLQGVLLLGQVIPGATQAEACFQQALAIARRQQAKSWELRAATSLARLWQQQGKQTAAYALLAPIYGWFTEGFDTADLQDAKALLVALR
jgi:predicted ATPase